MNTIQDNRYKLITQILKKYNILIDTDDKSVFNKYIRVNYVENETFKQWKNRIFGNASLDIHVYSRQKPPQQMQMSTIKNNFNCEQIKSLLAYCERKNKAILKNKIEENDINQEIFLSEYEDQLDTKYSTVPIDTLKSILFDTKENLEPSVVEMIDNFIESNNNLNIEDILKHIIFQHNNLVKRFKTEKNK